MKKGHSRYIVGIKKGSFCDRWTKKPELIKGEMSKNAVRNSKEVMGTDRSRAYKVLSRKAWRR